MRWGKQDRTHTWGRSAPHKEFCNIYQPRARSLFSKHVVSIKRGTWAVIHRRRPAPMNTHVQKRSSLFDLPRKLLRIGKGTKTQTLFRALKTVKDSRKLGSTVLHRRNLCFRSFRIRHSGFNNRKKYTDRSWDHSNLTRTKLSSNCSNRLLKRVPQWETLS
jgi:hypothetical protein